MTVDFQALRTKMVDGQVRTTDVTDAALLDAMLAVPREEFVPARLRPLAYIDEDLEVAAAVDGQPARYMSEPSPFARMIQLAGVQAGDLVLDVGCTTGYSCAILSRLASFVVGLESDADLAANADGNLSRLGFDNVTVVNGPLALGHADQAPYDVIIVHGAVDQVPQALLDQLKDGGRLVAVVGHGNGGFATLHMREGGMVSTRRAFNAALPALAEFRRDPAFAF